TDRGHDAPAAPCPTRPRYWLPSESAPAKPCSFYCSPPLSDSNGDVYFLIVTPAPIFLLSASFNHTTPAMMRASQTAWPGESAWPRNTLPNTAAPTEPIPAQTA